MKTYEVIVTRSVSRQISLKVEAIDENSAAVAAIEQAADIDFNSKGKEVGVEYSTDIYLA